MNSLDKEPSWENSEGNSQLRYCDDSILENASHLSKSKLISKDSVDKVGSINNKPSATTEGMDKLRDYDPEPIYDVDSHIVAHGRISRKQETIMGKKNEGYIIIPRSIRNDPRWNGLPLLYRAVLTEIFFLASYKIEKFDVFGHVIDLNPGQYGTTLESFIEKIGGEKLFPKSTVWRAWKLFDHYGWIRVETVCKSGDVFKAFSKVKQKLKQKKTVITITCLDACVVEKTARETVRETEMKQTWNTKEEREEREEKNHPLTPSLKNDDDSFSRKDEEQEKIHVGHGVWLTKKDLDVCISCRGSLHVVEMIVHQVMTWEGRQTEIKNWVTTIKTWRLKNDRSSKIQRDEEFAREIDAKYSQGDGWTARIWHDRNKDQKGILFESRGAVTEPIFYEFGTKDFEIKVNRIIKEKILRNLG